jgi:hypothetical protein
LNKKTKRIILAGSHKIIKFDSDKIIVLFKINEEEKLETVLKSDRFTLFL